MACYRETAAGIIVSVRLTPKGGRDAVDAIKALADGREVLLARVRAAPENGRANAALEALLADRFQRPKSAVRIIQGAAGRLKQVAIDGDPQKLAAIADRIGGDDRR